MSENTLHPQHDIIVALDIGTTKVCAIAGKKNEHGRLEVLGYGKVESTGVNRGVVSNIEKTVQAIHEAVSAAERMSGVKIKRVQVGIAGQHIKSLQHRGILTRENDHTEIGQKDIERLIQDMYRLVLPPGDKILHVIPQEFTVDNEQGITDPIGMSGVRLEANFHIITGQITASNNLIRCVERDGLTVNDITLEPIASAEAVLNEEEKMAGVALVDMGGGTTDLTIFHEGIVRHTAVIPLGGNIITKDIKDGCTVMPDQAEKLKVRFGSAMAEMVNEHRTITIPGVLGREPKEISERNLARIIQARVEEIFDAILWEIRRSGYERQLICGIVLTGGGAMLNNIQDLIEIHTGMPTRIGVPIEKLAHGYHKDFYNPQFSTGIGLLLLGLQNMEQGKYPLVLEEPVAKTPEAEVIVPLVAQEPAAVFATTEAQEEESADKTWFGKIFTRAKEWFEAEPDTDFNR